jgi:hypothetical protein
MGNRFQGISILVVIKAGQTASSHTRTSPAVLRKRMFYLRLPTHQLGLLRGRIDTANSERPIDTLQSCPQ